MKRYVQELANDILKRIDVPCNDFTDSKQREEVINGMREKIQKILNYCKVGLITDVEAVKSIVDINE